MCWRWSRARCRRICRSPKKQIDLYSRGLRGLIGGFGFLIVSGVAFGISVRLAVLGVFALAFVFLSTGISRMVQAKALRRLRDPSIDQNAPAVSSSSLDYLAPASSPYETKDLTAA